MEKVQVVYVVISTHDDIYLQEFWVSIYSLRLYDKDRPVRVLCDKETYDYIKSFPELVKLITEIIVVNLPYKYATAKLKSRQIKTTIRECVKGAYLFIDTDTTICSSLKNIDLLQENNNDICAVLDTHLPVKDMMFVPREKIMNVFGIDIMDSELYFNSGVMFVPDNESSRAFYKRWNENWNYSAFVKSQSLDQPALLKTDIEFGHVIKKLPDIYNVQIALSMKYFPEAVIIHWWHLPFIKNQEYNMFLSREIYDLVKRNKAINDDVANIIKNVKQSYESPSTVIGKEQIYFLFSPVGQLFCRIHKEGGAASWLANKIVPFFDWLSKVFPKKK